MLPMGPTPWIWQRFVSKAATKRDQKPIADDTEGMGLDPHRKRVVRTGDYFFVAAAAVACVALLVWAFFG